jgi:hypothetical protein
MADIVEDTTRLGVGNLEIFGRCDNIMACILGFGSKFSLLPHVSFVNALA